MCIHTQIIVIIISSVCTFRWAVLSWVWRVRWNRVFSLWLLFKWIVSPNWRFNWICNLNNGVFTKKLSICHSFRIQLKIQVQPFAMTNFLLLLTWSGLQNIFEFWAHLHSILMHRIGAIMLYPCIRTRQPILWLFNVQFSPVQFRSSVFDRLSIFDCCFWCGIGMHAHLNSKNPLKFGDDNDLWCTN